MFSRMKKSEVAEALIAAWCVEYLRVRKVSGFNVVEIIAISALMMGARAVVMETQRRRTDGGQNSVVMSNRTTQVGSMGERKHSA